MLILTNEEVESILTMEDCIEVLEHAFAELGHGRAIATNRYDLSVPAKLPSAAYYRLKTMNGALPSLNTAAVRINSDVATYPVKRGILRQEKVPAAKGKYVGYRRTSDDLPGWGRAAFAGGRYQWSWRKVSCQGKCTYGGIAGVGVAGGSTTDGPGRSAQDQVG